MGVLIVSFKVSIQQISWSYNLTSGRVLSDVFETYCYTVLYIMIQTADCSVYLTLVITASMTNQLAILTPTKHLEIYSQKNLQILQLQLKLRLCIRFKLRATQDYRNIAVKRKRFQSLSFLVTYYDSCTVTEKPSRRQVTGEKNMKIKICNAFMLIKELQVNNIVDYIIIQCFSYA